MNEQEIADRIRKVCTLVDRFIDANEQADRAEANIDSAFVNHDLPPRKSRELVGNATAARAALDVAREAILAELIFPAARLYASKVTKVRQAIVSYIGQSDYAYRFYNADGVAQVEIRYGDVTADMLERIARDLHDSPMDARMSDTAAIYYIMGDQPDSHIAPAAFIRQNRMI